MTMSPNRVTFTYEPVWASYSTVVTGPPSGVWAYAVLPAPAISRTSSRHTIILTGRRDGVFPNIVCLCNAKLKPLKS